MSVTFNREIYNLAHDFSLISYNVQYFRFPRQHVNISGRDVTELYMAINSPRSPDARMMPEKLKWYVYKAQTVMDRA